MQKEKLAYIAGIMDGNGRIDVQLIRDETYKRKWKIRLSVTIYQEKKRKWYVEKMREEIGMGQIKERKDGKMELTVRSKEEIKKLIEGIKPYLRIKKPQAKMILEIIKRKKETDEEFIEVCKMIDKLGEMNDSERKKTSMIVEKELKEAKRNKDIHL